MSRITFYSRRVHLLHNLVEPCEFKMSLGWFKGVPGKIAHADQGESRLLHERDILPDLFERPIDRVGSRYRQTDVLSQAIQGVARHSGQKGGRCTQIAPQNTRFVSWPSPLRPAFSRAGLLPTSSLDAALSVDEIRCASGITRLVNGSRSCSRLLYRPVPCSGRASDRGRAADFVLGKPCRSRLLKLGRFPSPPS